MRDYKEGIIYTGENCIGCNKCLDSCPVPLAQYSGPGEGGHRIYVDPDYCIACGQCIDNCKSQARLFKDDTEAFLQALGSENPPSLLVAPAFVINYPDDYRSILGYLRSLGLREVYSIGAGAELTTWAYLNYLQGLGEKRQGLIAQTCPSIVDYIEKFQPGLLDRLVPVQSPVIALAIYLKTYKGHQGDLALLSPCIAKKKELEDPNSLGLVKYNVTFQGLGEKLRGLDLSSYGSEEVYSHSLGSIYPMPGGLGKNLKHYLGETSFIYQIEGQDLVYDFLTAYDENPPSSRNTPVLIDCLNCHRGCNYGTGTEMKDSIIDHIPYALRELEREQKKTRGLATRQPRKRLARLNRRLRKIRPGDFHRSYTSRDLDLPEPGEGEIEAAFLRLGKETREERSIDCRSCGFNSCREMAQALALAINTPENCNFYLKKMLAKERQGLRQQKATIQELLEKTQDLKELEGNFLRETTEDFGTTRELLGSLSKKNYSSIMDLAGLGEDLAQIFSKSQDLEETLGAIARSLEGLEADNLAIGALGRKTNILGLNAKIESARASEEGFRIVAGEIEDLAQAIRSTSYANLDTANSVDKSLRGIQLSMDRLGEALDLIRLSTEEITATSSQISSSAEVIEDMVGDISHKYQDLRKRT